MTKGKYNIKAVSTMLGIPAGTLRMWERRYQMIAPQRSESGHRLYTDEQVQLLQKIVAKTKEGLTVRQAVALLETERERVEADERFTACLPAAVSFDARQLQQLWDQWMSVYRLEKVVGELFPAFLANLDEWERTGTLTNAHRQFVRSLLFAKLSMMLMTFSAVSADKNAFVVVGPGENDSLPLLLVSIYFCLKGYHVFYIGECVTEVDVLAAIEQTRPSFLLLACDVTTIEGKQWLSVIEQHTSNVSFGLIGKGTEPHPRYIGKMQAEWEKKLHL